MKQPFFVSLLALLLITEIAYSQQNKASVYFDLNQCKPISELSDLNKLFDQEGSIDLEVIGYTDYIGSEYHNLTLSTCRADAVGQYLDNYLGERIKSIKVHGKGELFSSGETLDGEPTHRRVDIIYKIEKTIEIETIETYMEEATPEKISEIENVISIDSSNKENIVLEGLSFIPGRHYTLPESAPILEKLLNTMKTNKTLEIEIQGFICCDYSVKDGFDNDTGEPFLSANRAKFVYDYLVRGGISSKRLSYKGYGSTRPKVFPENSPEDQQANRRVEIRIVAY